MLQNLYTRYPYVTYGKTITFCQASVNTLTYGASSLLAQSLVSIASVNLEPQVLQLLKDVSRWAKGKAVDGRAGQKKISLRLFWIDTEIKPAKNESPQPKCKLVKSMLQE